MSAATMAQWRDDACRVAYSATFRYFRKLEGISESVRIELTERSVRKAFVLARTVDGSEKFKSLQDLQTWMSLRSRIEFRRQLPLVREINQWLWKLKPEDRNVLLLDYESRGIEYVATVLNVTRTQAERQLTQANNALKEIIITAGCHPSGWMEPDAWM